MLRICSISPVIMAWARDSCSSGVSSFMRLKNMEIPHRKLNAQPTDQTLQKFWKGLVKNFRYANYSLFSFITDRTRTYGTGSTRIGAVGITGESQRLRLFKSIRTIRGYLFVGVVSRLETTRAYRRCLTPVLMRCSALSSRAITLPSICGISGLAY
jgi:hypothetical protein